MDSDKLVPRQVTLPESVWQRIEEEVERTRLTPEQFVANLVLDRFEYFKPEEG